MRHEWKTLEKHSRVAGGIVIANVIARAELYALGHAGPSHASMQINDSSKQINS